jgi:predicted molibdopterin-dependent oxidoreductase YjgC
MSTVTVMFAGRPVPAADGQTVGVRSWRTTRRGQRPRGMFCGIGVCFDCLLTIDGRPAQRACLVPVRDGMILEETTGD